MAETEPTLTEEAEAPPVAEAETEPKPVEAPEVVYPDVHPHYTVNLWKGIPNYACNDCTFARATQDAQQGVSVVMSHWHDVHGPQAGTGAVAPTGLVDAEGNPITRPAGR